MENESIALAQFQEEHQRLMRALHDSIDRESNLQRQLRRMKEDLVAVALRFQVALRLSEEDERTVMSLRKEASEAKMNELNAKKQAAEATEIIQSLKIEISALKRQVRDLEKVSLSARPSSRGGPTATSSSSAATAAGSGGGGGGGGAPEDLSGVHTFKRADAEVEEMWRTAKPVQFLPNTGGDTRNLSSFQQWKIQKFLYSPDTPAGSVHHDKHTVDMMAETLTRESLQMLQQQQQQQFPEEHYARTIKSRMGKLRPPVSQDSQEEKLPHLTFSLHPPSPTRRPATTVTTSTTTTSAAVGSSGCVSKSNQMAGLSLRDSPGRLQPLGSNLRHEKSCPQLSKSYA